MNGRKLTLVTLAMISALGSSAALAGLVDRVAAVVNNEVILLSEVDALCQYALSQVPETLPLQAAEERKRKIRMDTLDTLVDERLMQQQIKEKRIEVGDKEIDAWLVKFRKDNNLSEQQFLDLLKQEGKTLAMYKDMLSKTFQQQRLLGAEMRGKMDVSEQQIFQYYQEQYVRGSGAERIRASHILFAVPAGASAEQEGAVHERAQKILDALKAGADFAATAQKESDDPSASKGGDLGWFRRGDMVASFEKAAFGQAKGEMSGLVRTRFGYHIILVTDRAVEEPPPLDEVRNEVRKRLLRDHEKRLIRTYLDDLRRRAYIDIKL